MNKIEKTLIVIEVILSTVLVIIKWQGGLDAIGASLGTLLGAALIPFIIAIIFAQEDKEKNISKRLAQWKIFAKIYLPFLIITIIGSLV